MDELLNLDTISIQDIDLTKTIISKCGVHSNDALDKTIKKKLNDIRKLGYCFWAHGNLNQAHTKKFCEEKNQKDIYVIMPIISIKPSNRTKKSEEVQFKSWTDGKDVYEIPFEMEKVTGAPKSNRAFYFTNIYKLKENCDIKNILQYYYSINVKSDKPKNEAEKTLGGSCSNKCLEIKNPEYLEDVLNEFKTNDDNYGILIGKLCTPYHITLIR